jgi:hypothetical protein
MGQGLPRARTAQETRRGRALKYVHACGNRAPAMGGVEFTGCVGNG